MSAIPESLYFTPPSASKCSVIRSRQRKDVPEEYSSIRSVKDLVDQDYCDPHDPCCVNRDPEVFLHESVLRQSSRKLCAPKNPLHFEYTILHRFKLRRILQMAAERQQNEELTEEELAEIKRLEEEEDVSEKLKAHVSPSRAINMEKSSKPTAEPPPPPKQLPTDPEDLKKHLKGLTNLALAHEVALNKDFKLRKAAETAIGSDDPLSQQIQLAQTAKDRYFKKVEQILMKKDLKNHKHVVIDVLSMLKKGLQDVILPHNWSMREKIEQELDMKKVTKQIEAEAFDLMYYVDFVLDTLTALCCPIRDKEIVEIRDIPIVSHQIRKIVDLMEIINLDMANFVTSQSRSHTMQNCILYERNKFANYVETQYRAGYDPLQVTRDWIRRHSVPDRAFSEAMAHAFLEVLEWEPDKEWPETLALDWSRFPSIREEIKRVTVIGTIVSVVYDYALTLLKDTATEDGNDFEKNQLLLLKNMRLMSKLREGVDPLLTCEDLGDPGKFREALARCGELAGQIVDEHRQTELCSGIPEGEKIKIQQIVLPLTDLNHSVRQTYYDHVKEWFLELAKEDGKAKIHTPEHLRTVGSLIIVPVTEMIRLTMYNRGVFDILYRDIFDGNCEPPTSFPPLPEDKDPNEKVVLDANKYGQEDDDEVEIDENIAAVLAKLRNFKGRSMVYRRSRIDPRTKPMFDEDGVPIIPPERQPDYVPKQMTAIEQKHYDEYLLALEPTLDEDYEGLYNVNIGEPDWMFGYTTEQLLKIMERENLINENKLRRIKARLNQDVLQARVADNLPVFYKLWGKDFGALQKEFCRLQRILEKGPTPMPPGAKDEASGKRVFPDSCQPPEAPPEELPKVNERGEKLIYSSEEGRKKFGIEDPTTAPKEPEFDFEGIARTLADVKEVDPENFLKFPNTYNEGEADTALQKLLRNIPKPDPHWKMLDFRVRIPKSKSKKFQWSRMMKSMTRVHGDGPNSPLAQFGSPSQREQPSFQTTWTPSGMFEEYTGARKGGAGGRGAPTSNQTVVHMEIPLLIEKTAILTKADAPQMPGTSDLPPAFMASSNAAKARKAGGQHKKSAGAQAVRFPTVPMPAKYKSSQHNQKNQSLW